MAYKVARAPYFVGAHQETVQDAAAASEPVPAGGSQSTRARQDAAAASEPVPSPTVEVPRAGERFTDEDLAAKYGVPLRGGIRVSTASKCIVLVHAARDRAGYANTDHGDSVTYMGQNADRDGIQNQQMSGNNLALSRSKEWGCTVLYFIKEGDDLVFNSRVEYASHGFEIETLVSGQPRVVVKFELKAIAGAADPAPVDKTESLGCSVLAELEEDKLPTETIGEYVARMANTMEPGMCAQKDAVEMDEGFRQLARGEYYTLDDLRAEFDSKCT